MERKCGKCECPDVETDFIFGGNECIVCNHCGERTVIGAEIEEVYHLVQVEFQRTACPHCGCPKTKIKETSKRNSGVYRVHRCEGCKKRFSSTEPEHAVR